MGLDFRRRDYRAEERAHTLSRTRADRHPLSAPCSTPHQVEDPECGKDDFFDPLRATDGASEVSLNAIHLEDISSEATLAGDISSQLRVRKEWISFKKMLMQRFPVSKTTPVSMVSGLLVKGANRESSKDLYPGELDEHKKFEEDDVKVISQQECLTKLQELKDEINRSWCAADRVTALRLSIKVVRLLVDSSAIQFYPTLFVLSTDIIDMLGDLVWDHIKQKAETEEGCIVFTLSDDFKSIDICCDAKETCNNWFSKIGSVHELLPRIYLELAILPCWRFLNDHPKDILQRLVEMMRGIADPLTSAYCRLYLVQCAQRLPHCDIGFLITCINDLKLLLTRITPAREAVDDNLSGNSKLLLTLIEPAIEYILKCLFKDLKQMDISSVLLSLGLGRSSSNLFENCSSISIILHYILKELPIEITCSYAVELLHLIETTDDGSCDQPLNFKLLGHRLCEMVHELGRVHLVVEKVIQVLSCYDNLDSFLMVADAYVDIILENQLGMFLDVLLDGILERTSVGNIGENGLLILQSIFLKIITHFANIEEILALNHFVDILDMMHGGSRNSINMHILSVATRNGQIQNPTVIEVLLEVAQALYDGLDFSNLRKDDYQHPSRLICRFVYMVDHGNELESHLRFLARCRGGFSSISELQEILVHSCNNLAVKAMRDGTRSMTFLKSCLAFNEVTIPAIPTSLRQLNLYIETAEVALLGGFISHSDGLINAAVNCLSNVDPVNDGDAVISLICKFCGMLVMVPGSLEHGLAWIPKFLLSFLNSQSWMVPVMKTKVFFAVGFLSAALSQNQLPYQAVSREVIGNNQLFYGVQSCHEELLSLSGVVLQDILNIIMQESSKANRGKIALEACNWIVSSFIISEETLEACSKLVEIAKSCFSAGDKFLQSTSKFLDAHQFLV